MEVDDTVVVDCVTRQADGREVFLLGLLLAGVRPPLPACFAGYGDHRVQEHEQFDPTGRLIWWKEKIASLEPVETIYGFFNNDYSGYSIATCNRSSPAAV